MDRVYPYLAGRQLTKSEIVKFLKDDVDPVCEGKFNRDHDIKSTIDSYLGNLEEEGMVVAEPAVKRDENHIVRCSRCGSSNLVKYLCAPCQKECLRCEECYTLGVMSSCTELYSFKPQSYAAAPFKARLNFALTEAQKQAASDLLAFLATSKGRQATIWAACGAGKTEVLLPAIAYVVSQGGRVLYALPRRDVVQELHGRLEKALESLVVTALYGGAEKRLTDSRVIIATTHQVMRFYQAFDLVILDEEDAYPYKGSKILGYALTKVLKPGGKRIFATATPTAKLLAATKEKGNTLITIPARHHGEPVPVPELITISPWRKGILPTKAISIIYELTVVGGKPLLIFVPSKALAREVAELVIKEQNFSHLKVASSTSEDQDRTKKKEAMLRGELNILVSTSIFERGITIPDVQVVVWRADWEQVFDEGTLIQMAGRAGRTTEHPTGKVYFLGERVSFSMKEAKRLIEAQNSLAFRQGFIRRFHP